LNSTDNRAFDMTILSRLSLLWSTLGPIGRIPVAPGTWGALFALLLAPWCLSPLPLMARIGLVLCLSLISGLAAGRTEALLGQKDPGGVVADEFCGQWLALLPFSTLTPLQYGLGFVLFRFFDILKPWPIRAAESWLPGGFGIILDDLLAGVYAALGLMLWKLLTS
jgi:phosphatidylglycerophosphatase A